MLYSSLYDDLRTAFCHKMCSFSTDILWVDDLKLCFKKGTFSLAGFICKIWDRGRKFVQSCHLFVVKSSVIVFSL